MLTRCSYWLVFNGLLVLLAQTGCSSADGGVGISPSARTVSPGASSSIRAGATSAVSDGSTVNFTLSGGNTGSYSLHATLPTSKLRHGHREFTINVAQAGISIFLAFFGYQGPGTYTLSEDTNGGDVHIALGQDAPSWDLSLQPTARCTMIVSSDTPTHSVALDRMKGSFFCPLLFSSTSNHPQRPVTVNSGSFDVTIIVES